MRIKLRKWLWRPVEYLLVSAFKTVVMGVVFVLCAGVVMRWLGYPVPSLHQLQEYVTRLSDILL
ncbi:MAG: hypothetical protein QOF61_2867 [Acidobacteriota bacterium]|jgi:hypothetical protein|nr:hypothetical protein [Acidobacteriota bacterium]